MNGTLEKLVGNSQRAIEDGVYHIRDSLPHHALDIAGNLRDAPHAPLITEIKFASPSAGKIRDAADAAGIAKSMIDAGARALSVLTQPHLFGGSPEYLMQARRAVDAPILMKDIIIDKEQIDAAKKMGADCILLITALFERGFAAGMDELAAHAKKLGLGVLAESHTKAEFEASLESGADLIGINNRDLDTLQVDLSTTEKILSGYEGNAMIISESGIKSPADIVRLRRAGAGAFLVGSHIMKTDNIGRTVREMVKAY